MMPLLAIAALAALTYAFRLAGPLLPAGLPVLAALGGLAALWRPRRRPAADGAGDSQAVRRPAGHAIPVRSNR